MEAKDRLIVALDFPSRTEAEQLADTLGEEVSFYKIGYQLFMHADLDWLVEFARSPAGKPRQIFLDLKMDDIGRTIQAALEELPAEISMITLRGAAPAVRAARLACPRHPPLILGVPWLSNMNAADFQQLYAPESLPGSLQESLDHYLLRYAHSCLEAGCDGFIASGAQVATLRARFGAAAVLVSPGVRVSNDSADDHKRTLTPGEAIENGADYLVVGRPICTAPDPRESARRIIREIAQARPGEKAEASAGWTASREQKVHYSRDPRGPPDET